MASSGTTTTKKDTELVDNKLSRVRLMQQCWELSEILEILVFGGADSLTPDVDSIPGTTITGIWLVAETPTTGTEVGGGAGGVEV